jgi:hypothetical protein
MDARILRATVIIVKDSDEDGKMEIATRRKRKEDKVLPAGCPGVSASRLSFHTHPVTL